MPKDRLNLPEQKKNEYGPVAFAICQQMFIFFWKVITITIDDGQPWSIEF